MIYTDFLGNRVSTLGMGNMRLPTISSDAWDKVRYNDAQKIIDLCFDSGINYFDTAYVYHKGDSERFLGEALKLRDRHSYYLATKYLVTADSDYKKVLREQLEKLRTDYIDYYLIHSVQDNNEKMYIDGGAIDYFLKMRKDGVVKHLGFSFHASMAVLDKYLSLKNVKESGGWDFVQIQFNYLDYYHGDAKTIYDKIASCGLPIIVMEPVRGGSLSNLDDALTKKLQAAHDWSNASWALRFVREFPAVKVVLSGMHDTAQLQDNVKTFSDEDKLSQSDKDLIEQVAKDYKNQINVPCTACHYCCDTCPSHLDIPALIALYNKHEYVLDFLKVAIADTLRTLPNDKKADNCISCGTCNEHCPQHIDIPRVMQKIVEITR